MQWDAITDQWPWFAAAGLLLILIAAFAAYSFYKPKPKPDDPNQDQPQPDDGWTPTGRIDFTDPHSNGIFTLQVEETRVHEGLGGVEHRTIRWRKATLDEAKRVIVDYHAQKNLTMRSNFLVTSRSMVQGQSDYKNEHQQDKLKGDEGFDEKPERRVAEI
jgi:hypothetical protein